MLSFVPILTSLWVGAFEVFFITSILSAGFDLLFVFMQRFNRARIIKMMTLVCPVVCDLGVVLEEARKQVENDWVDLENVEPTTFGEGGFQVN